MSTNFFKVRNGINVGVLSADPSGGSVGDVYYNSTTNKLREYINGAWRNAVDEDSTQTLTNKTLTSPVINSPTGITKSDVGLGNVDNTSDATKNAAVATLTNKSLIDDTTVIVDSSDNTKQLKFNVAGTASTTTTIATTQTSNRTQSLQDVSDTFVYKGSVDQLTQKQVSFSVSSDNITTGSNATVQAFTTGIIRLTNTSLSSLSGIPAGTNGQMLILENKTGNIISINNEETTASSVNRIQTGSSNNFLLSDNATITLTYDFISSRWQLNGGIDSTNATSGIKNYLSAITTSQNTIPNTGNGNFELGSILGWSLGTVGTLTNGIPTGSPTFGSGASGNLSISTVNSGQLAGKYSLSYASSAATTQGNMLASDAFFIDTEDQAKVLTWKFAYKAQTNPSNANWSGTSSNSFGVAVYDVTNSEWLTSTANFGMTQSSGVGIATGTCQTNATTTQLRLVMYNVNATSGAITVYFDDFSVGPQTAPIGAAATDSQSYSATISGLGSGSLATNFTTWQRDGDHAIIEFRLVKDGTAGTGAAAVTVSLPPGLTTSDSSKINSSSQSFGTAVSNFTSAITIDCIATPLTTTFGFSNKSNGAQLVGSSVTANSVITGFIRIPIAGWSSNVQMSSDTDTRVVAFASAYGVSPTGTLNSSFNVAKFGTISQDTHTGYNTSTGLYTIPVTGFYSFSGYLEITYASASVSAVVECAIVVNGTNKLIGVSVEQATAVLRLNPSVSGVVFCNAGDTVGLYSSTNTTTPSYTTNTTGSSFQLFRLSGPSVIAATESVNAEYNTVAGQSISNNSATTVIYGSKDFDSHNAMNASTGVYTVPVSGKYEVNVSHYFATATTATATDVQCLIILNGSTYRGTNVPKSGTSAGPIVTQGSFLVPCVAGDTLSVKLLQNTGTSQALLANGAFNWITIHRIGN